MSGLPFMPFYVDDYLGDTQGLTIEEHGAYCLLIFEAWHHPEGLLLDDDKELARILRVQARVWKRYKARLMPRYFFQVERDKISYWAHKRITKEKNKSIKISVQNQAAARARWDKKDETSGKLARSLDVTTGKQSPNLMPDSKKNNDLTDATAYASTSTATTTVEEEGVKKGAREPGLQIIAALDEAIAETFGENQRRLNPASTDIVYARRFLEWGADLELCKGVFVAKCANRNRDGLSPPGSLKFFEKDITNALAELSKPKPEPESYHDIRNNNTGHSQKTEAILAGVDLLNSSLGPQTAPRSRDDTQGMVAAGEPDTGTSEFDNGNVIEMEATPSTGKS